MLVDALNRKINGWANYFCLGTVSPAYRTVERHTCRRLRQWLCVKHKEQAGETRVSLSKPCIKSLAWFVLPHEPAVFRGRQREPFSESWMR